MQAPNMALNVKKYLPMVLDYDSFTNEPVTARITERLMDFYGGSPFQNGLEMDTISDVS